MTLDTILFCAAILLVLGTLVWTRIRAPAPTSQERDALDALADDLTVLRAAIEQGDTCGVGERTVDRMQRRIDKARSR